MSSPGIEEVVNMVEKLVGEKKTSNLKAHAVTGSSSALAMVMALWLMFLSPMGDTITAQEQDIDSLQQFVSAQGEINKNLQAGQAELKSDGKKRDEGLSDIKYAIWKIAANQGIDLKQAKKEEPVIKFISPTRAFPVGAVLERGDTTFIPTTDLALVGTTP